MLAAGVVVVVVLAALVFTLLAYRRGWQWTGLPAEVGDGTAAAPARPAKTLWDWLQMLIVPLVLAVAAFGLSLAQTSRDRQREDRSAAAARRAEERQAARDRASAADRAREQTLQAYLKQMADLMTKPGRATADTQTIIQTRLRSKFIAGRRRHDTGSIVAWLRAATCVTSSRWRTG